MEAGSVRRSGSPYERGLRYCSTCRVYLRTNESRCPFCGRLLRTKRRHSRMPNDPTKFVRTQEEVQLLARGAAQEAGGESHG